MKLPARTAFGPALLALSALLAAPGAAADEGDEACQAALERAHPPGQAHGVLLQAEVPTGLAQDTGIVKHERQFEVDVVDGDWRTPDDGAKVQAWEESLRRGEVLRLASVRCSGQRVALRFVSVEDHYLAGGLLGEKKMRTVATTFRLKLAFRPRGEADVARVTAHLEPLIKLFPDLLAAKAFAAEVTTAHSIPAPLRPSQRGEVQPGMSQEEVLALLGQPASKTGPGPDASWTYGSRVVVFRGGHVTEVTGP